MEQIGQIKTCSKAVSHLPSGNYAPAALPSGLLVVWLSSYVLWIRRPPLAGRSRAAAHSEV